MLDGKPDPASNTGGPLLSDVKREQINFSPGDLVGTREIRHGEKKNTLPVAS